MTRSGSLAQKTLHTFGTLLFGQGASIAAGIATAHAFGPAGKGVIAYAAMLLTFAVTTADGLKSAIAYEIGTRGRAPRAVWRWALRLMAVLAPIGTIAFVALYLRAPGQPAFLFVAIAFPFAMYVQAIGIVYILKDRVERINVQNSLTIGGGYALVVCALVIFARVSVAAVLVVWVAGYVLAALWNALGLRNVLASSDDAGTPPERGDLRRQLGFVAKSALSANVTFLALRVDVFIVSALLAPAALGLYTLALAAGEMMWQVSRSVIWSSSGRVAALPFAESAELTARIVRSLVAIQVALGAALFVVGPWLIVHVYGSRFAESGTVLRLLLPGLVFYSADGMLSNFIGIRAGRPGLLLGLESVTLAVCAGLTLAAVPRYGIAGAAVADTVAYLLSFAIKVALFSRIGSVTLARVLVARSSDVPAFVLVRLGRRADSSSTRVS